MSRARHLSKVTPSAEGLIGSEDLTNTAISGALGYTPANKAGDTLTGTFTYSDLLANAIPYLNANKELSANAALSFNGTVLSTTTLDLTNLEVTNIKAKDGTASLSIADSTGILSISANPILSGGTANGLLYLNGSKVATSGSALTFDGTNLALTGSSPIYKVPTAGGSLFDAGGNNGIFILGSSNYVATYAGGTEQMRLTSTGLGLGITPESALHTARSGVSNLFTMQTAGSGVGNTLLFRRSRGTLATPLAADGGAYLGAIAWDGYDGASYIGAAGLRVFQRGDIPVTTGIIRTNLEFYNQDATGAQVSRLLIDHDGNFEVKNKLAVGYSDFTNIPTNGAAFAGSVGIGRTNPTYRLDVYYPGYNSTARFMAADGTRNPRIVLSGNSQGSIIQHTYATMASDLIFTIGGAENTTEGEVIRFSSSNITSKKSHIAPGYLPSLLGSTYNWDGSTLSFYWTKIANIYNVNDASFTALITTKRDVNYVQYVAALLTVSSFNNNTHTFKLECLTAYDITLKARIDNNGDVWIYAASDWASYKSWRFINVFGNPTIYTSNFVETITAPANSIEIEPGQQARVSQGNVTVVTPEPTAVQVFGNVFTRTGIQFPAVQNPSANANNLDDYEEGTWTPTLTGGSTAGIFTLSASSGKYTKVGNMVTLYCAITVGSIASSPTGNLQITGIPFACSAGTSANGAGQFGGVGQSTVQGVSFSTRGSSSILYVTYVSTSNNSAQVIQAEAVVPNAIIDFCISYPQA